MADRKKPAVVKALIFKSATKNVGVVDNKNVRKGTRSFTHKLIPKELNFFDMTPNAERRPLNPTEKNISIMKPSRMLVYEDSPEDNQPFKTTPPNVGERDEGTPGAPTKMRKDFDKKILRPKKLVYNDAENGEDEADYNSYRDTPKKSTRNEQEDFFGTLRRRIFGGDSSTSNLRIVDKPRSQTGSRKKSHLDNYNKENNAAVRLGAPNDQEIREKFESHKSRTALSSSSSKLGELTHFRI